MKNDLKVSGGEKEKKALDSSGEIVLERVKMTEKVVRQVEAENVLVFVVDRAVAKPEIKAEVENLFGVKVAKVRTHITKNKKVAYIKLKEDYPALDIATKLGMM